MAAPQQNNADIAALETPTAEPDGAAPGLDSEAPVGLRLAAVRKARGLSHVDVHNGTKIKILHVAAIEAGERAHLPATPFVAGFVKAYAQFLCLDADAYARAYKREAGFVPLAAPVQAAIVREVMQARASETVDAQTPAHATAASLLTSTALVPFIDASSAGATDPAAVTAGPARTLDADKLVTWLGAGAVIALAAFIAGRAAQPAGATSDLAPSPAPTIIAAAPAAVAVEPIAPVAEIAPQVVEPLESPAPLAAVKPPVLKPKPKKPIVEEAQAAPVSETPPSVLFTMLESAVEPAAAEEAPLAPAEEAPLAPEPKIIPARVTRSAAPVYPERCALRAGENVGVSVIFSITAEGRPVAASVASTQNRCFNSAALRAVYEMRFSPRTIDGAPAIESGKIVSVQFVR